MMTELNVCKYQKMEKSFGVKYCQHLVAVIHLCLSSGTIFSD
jgi:hypothetical protein